MNRILDNPAYVGDIAYRDVLGPGEPPIPDRPGHLRPRAGHR